MKKIFLFVLSVAMTACNVEPEPTFLTLDFEGEQWDDFHAGVATDPYSSNVVADGYMWQAAGSSLSSQAVVDEYGIIRGGMILSSYNSNDIATYDVSAIFLLSNFYRHRFLVSSAIAFRCSDSDPRTNSKGHPKSQKAAVTAMRIHAGSPEF